MVLFYNTVSAKMIDTSTKSILYSVAWPTESSRRKWTIRAMQGWALVRAGIDNLARGFDRGGVSPEATRWLGGACHSMMLSRRTKG